MRLSTKELVNSYADTKNKLEHNKIYHYHEIKRITNLKKRSASIIIRKLIEDRIIKVKYAKDGVKVYYLINSQVNNERKR